MLSVFVVCGCTEIVIHGGDATVSHVLPGVAIINVAPASAEPLVIRYSASGIALTPRSLVAGAEDGILVFSPPNSDCFALFLLDEVQETRIEQFDGVNLNEGGYLCLTSADLATP